MNSNNKIEQGKNFRTFRTAEEYTCFIKENPTQIFKDLYRSVEYAVKKSKDLALLHTIHIQDAQEVYEIYYNEEDFPNLLESIIGYYKKKDQASLTEEEVDLLLDTISLKKSIVLEKNE